MDIGRKKNCKIFIENNSCQSFIENNFFYNLLYSYFCEFKVSPYLSDDFSFMLRRQPLTNISK